jgi:ribosomal-protein-serine acetyltransferase
MITNKNEIDIILREIQLSDSPEIFKIIENCRDYLREWLPFIDITKRVEDTEAFIRFSKSKASEHDKVYVILSDEKITGVISYKGTDYVNHKTEIGYWLAKDQQGKGIVTRACKILIENAFEKMGMNRVQLKVGINNVKSAAIPQRLNFTLEGIERDGEFLNGKYINLEIYSILKQEWILNKSKNEAF